MIPSVVTVSPAFRKLAVKAVLSITLFIFTYLLLFALSVGLTVLCAWCALQIVLLSASAVTISLGFGLLCMGGVITFFLLKFIFARHKVDRSHLTEITREEEPLLFALIEEIVQEVETDFPKKIYLSADVNAAVFYDSSFWSMFFPVRKNLQIGMGLVNSITRLELKAILAHEFGHFSQRSMKLGSYVYNVNKVIYNMLYENESYEQQISSIASTSRFVAIFIYIAIGMVQGIQWILKKNYALINLTYMGLSREMEFHADEVAAHLAGSRPLISSLLRLDLSDQAFSRVLDFYDSRYQYSMTSANIYQQQRWMMEYLSADWGLPLVEGLPVLTEAHYERYSKSKLVIKDQWASHPSTEERIAALNKLNLHKEKEKTDPGNSIFKNLEKIQEALTAGIFSPITYPSTIVIEDLNAFKQAYQEEYPLFILPDVFNGYYNRWDPGASYVGEPLTKEVPNDPSVLFSDDMVNLVHSLFILENDKALLYQLTVVEHSIKTFDYDGVKYSMDNIYTLIDRLSAIIAENHAALKRNDANVHTYFCSLAELNNDLERWEKLYSIYAQAELQLTVRTDCYKTLIGAIKFMDERLPLVQIELRMPSLKEPEKNFKVQLSAMLEEEAYQQVLLPEQKDIFTRYISEDKVYFNGKTYDDDATQVLYDTLRAYPMILDRGYKSAKLSMLNSCAELMRQKTALPVE